jgi:hypothetical protein
MVRKVDRSWPPCGDFRRLNLVTQPDSYPLLNMLDFANVAAGCKIFSKIDLRKGYHQIPMHPDDICKTAITTLFGLFEYTRMPFSLCNASNIVRVHLHPHLIKDLLCSGAERSRHEQEQEHSMLVTNINIVLLYVSLGISCYSTFAHLDPSLHSLI